MRLETGWATVISGLGRESRGWFAHLPVDADQARAAAAHFDYAPEQVRFALLRMVLFAAAYPDAPLLPP